MAGESYWRFKDSLRPITEKGRREEKKGQMERSTGKRGGICPPLDRIVWEDVEG